MNKLENTYQNFFNENNIGSSSKFLIAVSGGADSMASLAVTQSLNLKVEVAHVNYQLRAQESDQETALIIQYCKKHKIELHILKRDCSQFAKKNKLSIQESARNIRYSYFEELITKFHFDYVITGHHLEDTIETFFLNAIRGSGIKGLSGIPKIRDKYIRPLLNTSKDEVLEYIKEYNIPYLNDSSNSSLKYDRNFLRNKVTPLLRSRFKNFNASLNATINIIEKENKLIQQLVAEKLTPFISSNKGSIHLENDASIGSNIWYHYLKNFGFNSAQVDDIVINKHQSGRKFFSEEYVLYIDRNKWVLEKQKTQSNDEYQLSSKLISNAPFHINANKIIVKSDLKAAKNTAYLDFDLLTFPLTIRKWTKGDYFIPFGMTNKKKISDFLIDNKVSQSEKGQTWVMLNKNEIIWLIGYRISDLYKISNQTKNCLHLKLY